jgi:hypothetical protein
MASKSADGRVSRNCTALLRDAGESIREQGSRGLGRARQRDRG